MAALAVFVGLAGGFGAVGFRYLIDFFQAAFYGSEGNLIDIISSTPWYLRILIPALGGLIVGPLVYFFAREAKGHGVPEVMEAVALKSGIIRKRIVFIKSLASAICIASGGSVGREGPIVQIGSAIGSTIGQILKVSGDRIRTLVGCGAAAGIAATFNAPIAGSMFALEIILGDFALATFSPIVISSVTATAISRHFLGNAPAIIVPTYQLISAWEFPLYVSLGLFCAVLGVTFTTVLYRFEDLFENLKFPEYLKAVLGGFIIGIMGLLFPHILGVGYGAIDLCLLEKLSWWIMLLLVFFKILSTSITIGSGGSGGIFAPSLFLGAMAGGFFGSVVHSLFPNITATPGAYGIVGMGAIVSATTHGPLTAILMLFEMTGNYKIILPLMIACIISSLAAGRLLKDSIYTLKLSRRGVNIKAGKEINVLKSILVKDVMNTEVDSIQENLSLKKLAEKISKSKHNSFPVVDIEENLTGILSFLDYHDIAYDENLKDLVVAKDLATSKVVTVALDDNIYNALEKITQRDFSILPVVAKENSTELVGVLTRRDIMDAYNKAVIKKSIFAEPSKKG
ncbi:MAG TPA: chloride channel protein [Desulfobacteraceae bacterium]|nr:chloride channel protein [Desulfobacteraceae bacterium]HPJ68403.1 chloride channel protein [Desulfobacteraceae bacterium]HPQ27235.1 chloride channel protein [Desulfobacteraceae bacterium]